MKPETGTTRGAVIKYALLPGILPRLQSLLGGGFKHLAYFIIVVFNTLRIIPDDHIYLRRESHGRFSVIQALAAAANNITFDRKNIDKVSIFFVVIIGLVMMTMQCLIFFVMLFTGKAFAYDGPTKGPTTFGEFFSNPNPGEDLAFRLLDLVFGMPDIFASKDMGTTQFHKGLHALFEFYSFGMLLVGTFIIIYMAITIVLETAETGVPFGKRFNKAWAPVRLIFFFGLLLPAANGLNLAQYFVLESAKLGSNLATNAWLGFDEAVKKSPYLGSPEELIARPTPPNLSSLVSFMQLAKTCSWAEGQINGRDIKPYAVFGNGGFTTTPGPAGDSSSKDNYVELSASSPPSYTDLTKRADGGTIFIRFGVQDGDKYVDEKGAVLPFCGELMLTVVDQAQPGATLVQQAYLELVSCMWHGSEMSGALDVLDGSFCTSTLSDLRGKNYTKRYSVIEPRDPYADMKNIEASWSRTGELRIAGLSMEKAITKGRDKQIEDGDWVNDAALEMGWAGAGIWFNKIAEQNGAFSSAVFAKPDISKMPAVMEFVRDQKLKENANTPVDDLYTPTLASGKPVEFEEPQQRDVLLVLSQLFAFWGNDKSVTFFKSIPESQSAGLTGNTIIDVMNVFMGTRGLFDMCKNTDVHPLAQLTSLGKGLVEHAIRGFALAAGTGIGGGILTILQQQGLAQTLQAASSFLVTFAGIGLMLGFILFYVIPFLPFIYFFFAVMTWIKSIFEAMMGMPLWALAHLHFDGEGMPGDAANSGYFYILEIFLRPIIILIGLMGGIAIFASMVKVMNQIFYLVLSNLAGHYVDPGTGCFAPPGSTPTEDSAVLEEQFLGGTVDEFFYTVIYAIIVYIFAIPCFKLVDMVPDNIMRWMGAGISSFGSQDGDPAQGLMTHVTVGGSLVGSKAQEALGGVKGALSDASRLFG